MEKVSDGLSAGLASIRAGVKERARQAGIAMRTFRKCWSEAFRQARLVDHDRHAQRHYRKLYAAGDLLITSTTSNDPDEQESDIPTSS